MSTRRRKDIPMVPMDDLLWGKPTDARVELAQGIALATRLASMSGNNRVTVTHVPAGRDQELKDGYFVRLGQDLSRKSQSNHVVLIGMIFSKNDMKQVFAEWSDFMSTKQ